MNISFYCSLSAAILIALTCGAAHAQNANYSLTATLPLPGATRWDYLAFDTPTHRLFITRGESVDVLDVTMQKVIGTIPDTAGVHGIALADELGKGFASNGKANTVSVFDLSTLKPLATLPTGNKPDAIVYDTATKKVFVANGESNTVTVIDAAQLTVVGTVKLDGAPEFGVVDGKGRLYINLEDKAEISVIDTKSMKVMANYDLASECKSPTGIAMDITAQRLFSVCANKVMMVTNAINGKIVDTLPIGAQSDAAAFDAGADLAFASNGDGTLTVVGLSDDGHYQVLQNVMTLPTARTMAIDPITHTVYLAAADADGFDPPTAKHPEPRPRAKPDTFKILSIAPVTPE